MLELTKYMRRWRDDHPLAMLDANYRISHNRHSKYPNLIQLNYHMIDSPRSHPMVHEARGVILDENNNYNPVAFPFTRFFNYQEEDCASLDWNTVKFQEKLDGSLCILYHYNNEWQVATRGKADAMGEIGGNDEFNSFNALFWYTWGLKKYVLPVKTTNSYAFELMTPHNKVVVQHTDYRLVLIGARDMLTLKEIPVDYAYRHKWGWEVVKEFDIDMAQAINRCVNMSGFEQEGFVIRDKDFNRLKLKGDDYVRLHHIRSTLSVKNVLSLFLGEESDVKEFLSVFGDFNELYHKLLSLQKEIMNTFIDLERYEERKEFALEAVKYPYASVLFALRDGKVQTAAQGLARLHIKKVEEMIE